MKKIEQPRSRLATLTGAKEVPPSAPAEDLKACRALQERLRELKEGEISARVEKLQYLLRH